eukprot:scaffold633342_cov15-Prasinocladus_malaysianus.AAC.1
MRSALKDATDCDEKRQQALNNVSNHLESISELKHWVGQICELANDDREAPQEEVDTEAISSSDWDDCAD